MIGRLLLRNRSINSIINLSIAKIEKKNINLTIIKIFFYENACTGILFCQKNISKDRTPKSAYVILLEDLLKCTTCILEYRHKYNLLCIVLWKNKIIWQHFNVKMMIICLTRRHILKVYKHSQSTSVFYALKTIFHKC